jgi:hypothetical protein
VKILLLISYLFFSLSSQGKLVLQNQFRIDGQRGNHLIAGQKTKWDFSFYNSMMDSNHRMFMPMHAKLMHTVVIGENLSHFAHIHPAYNKESGVFSSEINGPMTDPDNVALPNVIPYSGRYYVLTEVMPMKRGEEFSMKIDRYSVEASGKERQPPKPNIFKEARSGITKYFDRSGDKALEGSYYKVIFSYEQFDFCDYWLPKFYFELFNLNKKGEYVRTTSLTRWLEMGGHSIIISNDERPIENKVFHHLHAFLPMSTAGEVTFPYHDHINPFSEGEYKIWGQFKDKNQILTFPFEFKYTLPAEFPLLDIKC